MKLTQQHAASTADEIPETVLPPFRQASAILERKHRLGRAPRHTPRRRGVMTTAGETLPLLHDTATRVRDDGQGASRRTRASSNVRGGWIIHE